MTKWTDAQKQAIYEPSGKGSILVSAAAGSGKTAVLVERIVNMILNDGISIDELLIVTFTEAASAEMKERIISRINDAYREAAAIGDVERGKHLKEQMRLTPAADINTIDAFCLGVVKNNFHILGIDAGFGIMDKNEGELLIDDTLSELFLSLYAAEEEEDRARFLRLADIYASNRDDEGLKKVVRKVYGFIQSFPEPMRWLREKADMYNSDMTESDWLQKVIMGGKREYIIKRCKSEWSDIYSEMLAIAEKKSIEANIYWGKLWSNVCACNNACAVLENADSWDKLYEFYKTYIEKKSYLGSAMNKIPAKKEVSDEEWQAFYDRYDELRNFFREECQKLPLHSKSEYNDYVHGEEIKQTVDDIVWLTEKFSDSFSEKKSRKNVKSFSDIEHLAYRLFSENENIRGEYAEKYREILIDEFQDTNSLQDAIFTLISRNENNMFMVGDLKQSIYRFRGGDPTVFKNKSRNFMSENSDGRRIVLSQNFRSRQEVITGINSLFAGVMSDEVGDVEYNCDEELKREQERECYTEDSGNPFNSEIGYNSELYRIAVIGDEAEEDVTAERAEAAFIADKIRSLVDGHYQVYDKSGYRDIEYRDIVILMRSIKGGGEVMREMLESRGISSFVQKEEYFARREIKLMLSLISIINNHMQDIPLVAVMRSPIGDFTENELARIKIGSRTRSFYKAVKGYKSGAEELSDEEKRLRNKCRKFISDLDRWRGYVRMKSIASLIWTLYEETGFYDLMGALEGGEEAQANLKLLYERAKKYEESGFKGIFNFIRYIERMESRNEDIAGARLVSEGHNVVKIMTIHKSKGLEFPVVFLARTTKKFLFTNPRDENRVMLHKDLGIGVDYYNYNDMYCKKLVFNEYIKEANKREYLSEEMRLLYVAVTRAKEKLIVTAANVYKDSEACRNQIDEWRESYFNKKLTPRISESARSYADWIIPAVESNGQGWKCTDTELMSVAFDAQSDSGEKEIVIENTDKIREYVKKILEFKYEYPQSGNVPAKTSVTAIKELEDAEMNRSDEPVYMTQKPQFMRTEKLGAQIGTAHHQVMAFIDIQKLRQCDCGFEETVKSEIIRIYDEGQIEKSIAEDEKIIETICNNVCGFFKSDMGKAVLCAKNVYRERPFEISITAREYDASLGEEYGEESIIVQGIIDLYFEDNDGNITLVDYKTDYCKTPEEQQKVADRYKKQLELYGRAMEKILQKPVKNKYLYLFSAQSMVKLD